MDVFFFNYSFCIWVFCLHVCLCITCMPGTAEARRGCDHLGLEFLMIVSILAIEASHCHQHFEMVLNRSSAFGKWLSQHRQSNCLVFYFTGSPALQFHTGMKRQSSEKSINWISHRFPFVSQWLFCAFFVNIQWDRYKHSLWLYTNPFQHIKTNWSLCIWALCVHAQ